VIVTGTGSPAALAAKQATSTIPIVFSIGADPIGLGLVSSYNRPGANVTGMNVAPESLTAKRFELLNDLVPKSLLIAELINPANGTVGMEQKVASEAARALGRTLLFLGATSQDEIVLAFEEMGRKEVGGLIIWLESLFTNEREQIIFLANRYRIPTVCPIRQFTDAGALLSYGPNTSVTYRQVGTYYDADQIRPCHQSQGCQGPGPDDSARADRYSRRCDRIASFLPQRRMSAFGT
jgi:putative ABC transport system substrate-binding protein